jgi:signal transduction histidine kinase
MKTVPFLSFFATLRGRLLLLVCLATLPAILFTFYVAHNERERTLQHSEAEGKYILNIVSQQHIAQISSAKALLRWLANKIESEGTAVPLEDKTYLAAVLSGYPQLANIAFVAPNGDVKTSAFPMTGSINMLHFEAIQRALKSRQPESGAYVVGLIVKRPLLHLAQSVYSPSGQKLGVVFVALDLEYMNRLLKQVELPPGYALHIVDRQGNILANSTNAPAKLNTLDTVMVAMDGLPGLRIATTIPYVQIHAEANSHFFHIVSVLSLLTLSTVASVVFLEEFALLRYLRMLARASRRFGDGDFSVRVKMPYHYGELERMANAFNTMADTLEERHKELLSAHNQLNNLTGHLQIARESERLQIARDLHDEVGQVLTSIKMDLSGFAHYCPEKEPRPCQKNLEQVRQKLDGLVAFIRRIASSLRPQVLDGMGLVKALQLLARNTERNTELTINVEASVEEPLEWMLSTTIYRIVQESLTNVVRHAKASEVNITIVQEDETIKVQISDDGVGLQNMESTVDSLGIIGMRERAKMMTGELSISDTGHGTTVKAILPRTLPAGSNAYPIG